MSASETERVAIITGANTGIGKVTATELARRGHHVFLACRSEERTAPVVEEIRRETGNDAVELLLLDLGSLVSVRHSAATFLERGLPLQLLINNAGLPGKHGASTEDGFELAFGVDHVGHFLFTMLLRERLIESAPSRVVTVASQAHYKAKGIDFEAVRQPTRTRIGFAEYQVAKLANVLFSAELHRRESARGLTTYAVHPGVIASSIWRDVPWPIRPIMLSFMRTAEEGARSSLHCALDAGADESGLYWHEDCRPREPSALAQDEALAGELWERSLSWTELA